MVFSTYCIPAFLPNIWEASHTCVDYTIAAWGIQPSVNAKESVICIAHFAQLCYNYILGKYKNFSEVINMNPVYEKLIKCRDSVRTHTDFVPEIALILGSGHRELPRIHRALPQGKTRFRLC